MSKYHAYHIYRSRNRRTGCRKTSAGGREKDVWSFALSGLVCELGEEIRSHTTTSQAIPKPLYSHEAATCHSLSHSSKAIIKPDNLRQRGG